MAFKAAAFLCKPIGKPSLPSLDAQFSWWRPCSRHDTPFFGPSCQTREEKRKFSLTANSLVRRRQGSWMWAPAQRPFAKEKKWRVKVHQAPRNDHFSSRSCFCCRQLPMSPTLPLLSLSLSLSLFLSLTRFDALKSVIVLNLHNILPILGGQLQHLSFRPVLFGFSLWFVGFPVLWLGDWFI